ncbi:MAG TPA: twin-arginine translocase subunit TatC [Thermodesulfobacteriaceae bacterium]|nr:twin-arginine translocase subunit TatC [Thermodesulfobacteriaceae bacterium]
MTDYKTGEDHEFTLVEHLTELRNRLMAGFVAAALGCAVCYAFIEPIFAVLARPLEAVLHPDTTLIFISYPEAFFAYLKLALTCGIFLTSPFILYQIWAFVAPGLYEHEKRLALPFVVVSSVFFTGGAMFGYFVAFPAAFKFLAGYAGKDLRLLPSVSEYFTLTVRLLLGFGLAFELPVFMVFLSLAGMIDAGMLNKNRKYAILTAFVAAAILTPTPDIVNQILLAGPLIILYELSVLAVWLLGRKKENAADED